MKFLRKEIGQEELLPKKPLFQQGMEHFIDTVGIETEASLQREFSAMSQLTFENDYVNDLSSVKYLSKIYYLDKINYSSQ